MSHQSIDDIAMSLHARYLSTLNLYRFIQSRAFMEAYIASVEDDKRIAATIIEAGDKSRLEQWVKNQLKKLGLIEVLDVRYLRKLGQEIGIKNYAILPKLMLIAAIQGEVSGNGVKTDHS